MNKRVFSALLYMVAAANLAAQSSHAIPRLVVGITIDKLRTDYLEAFSPLYGEDGFNKLINSGCIFSSVQYASATQDRASSLASIYTGTVPYSHGIIGEDWLDRKTLRPIFCVDDFSCRGIETTDGTSPKNLLVSTIGDELKMASSGKSIVYSIAPYREEAVLAAGHSADFAIWIDNNSGKWAGTSYYGQQPSWVKNLQTISPASRTLTTWKPLSTSSASYNYYLSTPVKVPFNHSFTGDRRYYSYKTSGLVNEDVTKAVHACLLSGTVGTDDNTDMLSVCYYAGTFNRQSITNGANELQDTYVRLDAEIASLLKDIDKTVGIRNTLIFVTSTGYDDSENDRDLASYHIPTGDFQINRCASLLNMYLMAMYGNGQYVDGYFGNQLYLNHKLLEQKQLNLAEMLERCEDFLFQYSGIRDVYTSQRLIQGAWTPGISRIRNGYNPKNSGDITIQVSPGWTLVNEDNATRQLQRDSYFDFPIFFYGYGIAHEKVQTPVTVDCIAPTIAHSIRIRAPNGCSSAPLNLPFSK